MEAVRPADEMSRQLGVSKATFYGWKAKSGGLEMSEAKTLRELEDEKAIEDNMSAVAVIQ